MGGVGGGLGNEGGTMLVYILYLIKIKTVPPSEAAPSHSPPNVRGEEEGVGGRGLIFDFYSGTSKPLHFSNGLGPLPPPPSPLSITYTYVIDAGWGAFNYISICN